MWQFDIPSQLQYCRIWKLTYSFIPKILKNNYLNMQGMKGIPNPYSRKHYVGPTTKV